jgi:hypothetical protein
MRNKNATDFTDFADLKSVITILRFLAFLASLRIKPRRGGQKLARGGAKRNPWQEKIST